MAEPGVSPDEPGPAAATDAPPEPLRLVVFDLDGTLIDSLGTIARAVAAVRHAHRGAPLPIARVRDAIGEGSRILAGRVFADLAGRDGAGDPEIALDRLHREFIEEYRRRTAEDREVWRPGARELLSFARSRGLALALLSNKPLEFVEEVLSAGGTRELFAAVFGPENSRASKPDPRALLDVVRECGASPGETCYVGDSVVDFATGRSAGVFTIGVRGGYRAEGEPAPDLWLDDPPAVARWLALALGSAR